MEKAKEIVNNVGELPPIPAVLLKTMELLNDPSASVRKIQDQVLLDPALTSFILKVSNSALYSLRQEVTTISYAVNLIGYNTTRSILTAFLSKNVHAAAGNKMIQGILWKHSISTAVFARQIAQVIKKISLEEAFIAGLLHDIGKAVLLRNKPDEYEKVVELIYNENKFSLEAEEAVFGFSHVEVGYLIMKKWGFSDLIVETCIFHNNYLEYSGENLMIPVVSLANKLSHINYFYFNKVNEDLSELELLGISETDLKKIQEGSMRVIDEYLTVMT
jgi:putative nucleotidyltransferase with HDIG domain